jgi:hypothetical protein
MIGAIAFLASFASAQPTLPPLPPPTAEPSPPAAPPAPPADQPAPPPPTAPAAQPPGPYAYAPPPSGPSSFSSVERTHAPRYSLWLGGGLGLLVYSGALYISDPSPLPGNSGIETTGNFVRPGVAIQPDIGVRLGRRYIPYLTLEVGIVGAGRRFDGAPGRTSASTYFAGVGFRYLAGDVDSISFVGDISLGVRRFQVSNGTGTWSASALELFRLGFGADMRLSSRFTVTPMITISSGTVTDASGNIQFAPSQPDGQTNPPFTGSIPSSAQQSYFVIVLGCSAHVDLFGK